MKKIIIIGGLLVVFVAVATVFVIKKEEEEEYTLPEIVYCGHEKGIVSEKLSQISYVENSICSVFGGEMFASPDEAKVKYGTKVDLKQKATSSDTLVTTQHSAFPGEKIKAGEKEIKVLSTDGNSAQIEVDGAAKNIAVGKVGTFDNLEVKVKFACPITYRVDFNVTEYACCPPEEEKDEETKAAEETEKDLKMSGRSGYKGVILPKNVAREYPSTDFAILPFVAIPNELCCGCKQEYKNLFQWGDYLQDQAIVDVLGVLREMNKKKNEYEQKPYTLVERSESGMRFILNEINYTKQNEAYFDPATRVPKGKWINPDYVIEGEIKFSCCEDSELVNVTFVAKFINAKTGKVFEQSSYTPAECFDLVKEPGRLMAVVEQFSKQISSAVENRFARKK